MAEGGIPLLGGRMVHAYHVPDFNNHILSVSKLLPLVDVMFSESIKSFNGCFMFEHRTRNIVFEIPIKDSLYRMSLPSKRLMKSNNVTANNITSEAELWHEKVGHISTERYTKLAEQDPSIKTFSRSVLDSIFCQACIEAKSKKAPVRSIEEKASRPIQEVHVDISGKISPPALSGEIYAAHFICSHTAKYDVCLLHDRGQFHEVFRRYKEIAENHFAPLSFKISKLRVDNASELTKGETRALCISSGIQILASPAYAPESNGTAERLVQEHRIRAKTLMSAANLPNEFWGEAIAYANWLRNRTPCARIGNRILIKSWDPNTRTDFSKVPSFGQTGFAFLYLSKTTAGNKLHPRSLPAMFMNMSSDVHVMRVYVPSLNQVRIVRINDFRIAPESQLPRISTLLDGLARQVQLEAAAGEDTDDKADSEAHLMYAMTVQKRDDELNSKAIIDNQIDPVHGPETFKEALRHSGWRAAIDKEYYALLNRNTWTTVDRLPEMNVIPYLWTFRAKFLDPDEKKYMYKARCVSRGDLQLANIDFDPDGLYAPVASHESIRLLIAFCASTDSILEGADIGNAYLYGSIQEEVYMEQPTDSSGRQVDPGKVCGLSKSIYGLKQAGNIRGSVLHDYLMSSGFTNSQFDKLIYFLKNGTSFITIAIVVGDMAIASNDSQFLCDFKTATANTFDLSLFGELKTFLVWRVTRTSFGIWIDQEMYANSLLRAHKMSHSNPAFTPLALRADKRNRQPNELALNRRENARYRSIVGGLLHLSVSTRPDLSFPFGILARNRHEPTPRHMLLAKIVLRYVKGTAHFGIMYRNMGELSPNSISATVDADWACCLETSRSTTGYEISLNGTPFLWKPKRQNLVTLSSAESEYVAMCQCAKEVSWIRCLYWEIYHQVPWNDAYSFPPTVLRTDCTAEISISSKDSVNQRTRHIRTRYHYVREKASDGTINIEYLPGKQNPSDLFTKVIDGETLTIMLNLLNME